MKKFTICPKNVAKTGGINNKRNCIIEFDINKFKVPKNINLYFREVKKYLRFIFFNINILV